MNNKTIILIIIILIIGAFIAGYYLNNSDDSVVNLQSQIMQLQQENTNLQSQVEQLQGQLEDLISQQSLEEQCKLIEEESDAYYQQFRTISCSSHDNCIKVLPPVSCGVCVHNSIDEDKVLNYKDTFDSKGCNQLEEYQFGCAAAVSWCDCIDNVCQTTYNPPE
ncbi:MAG: hypothetical protein KJ718_03520 [Nanoarchaeota archaeon]|nr:hypothetical protein [Nanoarchaeota archaeon]